MATKKTSAKKSASKKSRPAAKKKSSVQTSSARKSTRPGRGVTSSAEESRSLMEAASSREGSGSSDYSSPSFSSTGGAMTEEKRKGLPVIAIILGVLVIAVILYVWRSASKSGENHEGNAQQTTMQATGENKPNVENAAPATEEATVAPEGMREYIVKKGDNPTSIARKELGDAKRAHEILDLNKDVLPKGGKSLKTGMKLKLPAKR